jgi:hypothetical protein
MPRKETLLARRPYDSCILSQVRFEGELGESWCMHTPKVQFPDAIGLFLGRKVLRLRTLRRGKLVLRKERKSVR